MTPEELRTLIAQGEGQRLEFKRSLAELETGTRATAAMSNTDGGYVLFGVRKDGTILGVEIGAQTRERVVRAITDNTDPTLYPSVEYVDVDSRTIIVVTVVGSEDRPHLVRGRAYKRVGAADVQMSRAEYERLLLARRQPPFDQQLVEGATYADLDEAKVRDFLRRRQEAYPDTTPPSAPLPQVVIEMLEGARERGGELVPTYTGLLFFGRNPQRFLPRAEVKLARFQGTTTLAFIDRVIIPSTGSGHRHNTLPERCWTRPNASSVEELLPVAVPVYGGRPRWGEGVRSLVEAKPTAETLPPVDVLEDLELVLEMEGLETLLKMAVNARLEGLSAERRKLKQQMKAQGGEQLAWLQGIDDVSPASFDLLTLRLLYPVV